MTASIANAPDQGQPMQVATHGGLLHGTLLVPLSPGPHPVALVIAGSGATDRNGNSLVVPGRNNCLKLLAEGLQQQGIATLRYDKRGVGASRQALAGEATLRFETLVDDAVSWVQHLRTESRFSRLIIV